MAGLELPGHLAAGPRDDPPQHRHGDRLAYPLSEGPLHYAYARGWVAPAAADRVGLLYVPLGLVVVHELPSPAAA